MSDVDLVFDELIYSGIESLKSFSENEKASLLLLQNASKSFSSAIKVNRKRPEPYFYLSYIFCLYKEKSLANKYLNLLEILDPNFPSIDILKSLINKLNRNKTNILKSSNFLSNENYNYKTIESSNSEVDKI